MLFNTFMLSLLAATTHAFPASDAADVSEALVARQLPSSTELERGICRRVTFIFARGSTEPGNMGSTVGPDTCSELKSRFGSLQVACQGVGGPYTASLAANTLPRGTTTAAINEASRLFRLASTQCPDTIVVAAGYSQGAAVIAGSLSDLQRQAPNVAGRVAGAVLYGYTKNEQYDERIPDYPTERTLIICNVGDLVCEGTLIIAAPHLLYGPRVPAAVDFLEQRVAALG